MKEVHRYCAASVPGWDVWPDDLLFAKPGEEGKSCGFVNRQTGLHLLCSIKAYPMVLLHVSIGIIRSFRPDLTEQQHEELRDALTPEIIQIFFGDRQFARQPDDPRRPTLKNYFAFCEESMNERLRSL